MKARHTRIADISTALFVLGEEAALTAGPEAAPLQRQIDAAVTAEKEKTDLAIAVPRRAE